MPVLPDPRRELYCQNRARGLNEVDAHETAGFKRNRGNAARLNAEESIVSRIAELNTKAAEEAVVDATWIRKKLKQNAEVCMTLGSTFAPSAANKALELLGKDKGMFVDRRLIGVRNIDDMTEEELLEFLGGEPPASELGAAARPPKAGDA
jgi:3-oxoacyl-(acyl-carrier-protein) synthase